jgi:4-hydroxy-2-oxoheptanedioate aldolase
MRSLKTLWAEGKTTLGAWVSLRDPLVAEVAASAGFDYVCVDMQHGLQDLAQAMTALHAMAGGSAVPVVRVPWNEPGIIGRVLDAGALGVIIPMVNTPDDAPPSRARRYAPRARLPARSRRVRATGRAGR